MENILMIEYNIKCLVKTQKKDVPIIKNIIKQINNLQRLNNIDEQNSINQII